MKRVTLGQRVYVRAYGKTRRGRVLTYREKNAKVVTVLPTDGRRHIVTEAIRRLLAEDDEDARASLRGLTADWPTDEDLAAARLVVIGTAIGGEIGTTCPECRHEFYHASGCTRPGKLGKVLA